MDTKASSATRLRQFNWEAGLFLIAYHLVFLIGLPFYLIAHSIPWGIILSSLVLVCLTGFSITMGYHRFYSHTTFKSHPAVEWVLLFFGTAATQGSVLRWAFDHRIHHAFVDTDRDPYSIRKGFWYAHCMWLFEKPQEIDPKVVSDLMRKPALVWQHRHYGLLMIATNLLLSLLMGWAFNNYLAAFLFGWLGRVFVVHHCTWFINSLAHTWGARTFCQELSAVDNFIIATLTFGEGYHNFHHSFSHDYRNGIRWFHFDPTKWIIWTLSKCGLTSHLKSMQRVQIEERILAERKSLLLEKIAPAHKEDWEQKISHAMECIVGKLQEIKKLKTVYCDLKKQNKKNEQLQILKLEMKLLKRSLSEEYQRWSHLTKKIPHRLET